MALNTRTASDPRQVMIGSGWDARGVDGRVETVDEDWENPTIYVDAAKRREVESFAAKLEGAGLPASQPSPEYTPYARLDAAALLTRISKDKAGLLQALQAAVLAKNLEAFVAALEDEKAAKPGDLKQLKDALRTRNTEKFADVLRKIAEPELQKILTQQASLTEDCWGNEVANTTDPLMGTERRTKGDSYLTCYDHNRYGNYDMIGTEPIVRGRPKDLKNMIYTTIELGHDADKWEEDMQFHPFVLDTMNASSDLMMEANGFHRLDGRLIGDRDTGSAFGQSINSQQTEG